MADGPEVEARVDRANRHNRADRRDQPTKRGRPERHPRESAGDPETSLPAPHTAAPTAPTAPARRTGRLRNPVTGLPHLWVEAVVLVSLYYTYTATRGVAGSSAATALETGWDILHLQERLHIDIELGLNRWLQSLPVLAVACCYYYATLHFVVTPALLFWMYRRHPRNYVQARWTLVFTTLISLCGFFLLPTAPPRLLPGTSYVDTMAHFEAWGWWSGGASAAPDGLEGLANQYAAMPSLHCAWALWCGFLLARFARTRVVRVLGALYPATTVFVVMATSNHYILDAVAGWAVLGVSAALATALTIWSARRAPGVTDLPAARAPAGDGLGDQPAADGLGSEPAGDGLGSQPVGEGLGNQAAQAAQVAVGNGVAGGAGGAGGAAPVASSAAPRGAATDDDREPAAG